MDKNLELELIQEIDPNQLSESQQVLYKALGRETFIELSMKIGGADIYIPQIKELIKSAIYNRILEEFDGSNVKFLSNKYKISKTTIYNIVRNRMR